jgi:ParB family chromosome partitioning protein
VAKNSAEAYGASGKTNLLNFDPHALHLVDDPAHALYDERIHLPLMESMVLNVMELGVLEPIIIWKDPEMGKTCVVVGRQRVKHAREANKRLVEQGKDPLLVPGYVKRGSAIRMSQYMVSENEIHQPDSPIGRAKKMTSMLERGHDEDHLVLLFGCSLQTVRSTLALLDSPQVVQDAIEAGEVTLQEAKKLSALTPDQQREKVQELKQAAEGAEGREKVRRKREIMGDAKPKLKSRKEITAALQEATGEYATALRWVLGEKGGSAS